MSSVGLVGPERVVVIGVTWNSEHVLPTWLQSVCATIANTAAAAATVLVVDNHSDDRSRDLVRAAGLDVVDTGANLGYAGAINVASDMVSRDAHLLILNPDTTLHPGCIDELHAGLDAPGVGLVVPRIVDANGVTQPSLRRFPSLGTAWGEAVLGGRRAAGYWRLTEVVQVGPSYDVSHDVDWATGAAVFVSARARAILGHWDPTFFLYSEETEYMWRAAKHGLRTRYRPSAVVEHIGGDQGQTMALWRRSVANRIGLFRRHNPVAVSLAYQGGVVLNETLRSRSRLHRAGLRAALRPSREPSGPQRGVVGFAGVDWWYHNRGHSDVQLLRCIGNERPVVMVNSIGLRVPLPGRSQQALRRIGRKLRSALRYVSTPEQRNVNFHVMTPLALPVSRSGLLQHLSARAVSWQVERVARWYLMPQPHVLVTLPSAAGVVATMPHTSLVFNRSDLQSAFPEADNAAIETLEAQLLVQADLVLYVSRALMAKDAPIVGARAHFLDHGVDVQRFTATSHFPGDIAVIPKPRIGFFGGLDDYVIDFALLEQIARRRPDWSLVLIGDATCPMERLTSLGNVHWLGMRPYADIAAYGSAFNVAIMPWLDNDWIRHCNPIKVKEYLALGLPVVSTEFPELDRYRDLISVAQGPESFVDAIERCLEEPDDSPMRAKRRARVVRDTWEAKARELMRLLDELAVEASRPAASPAVEAGAPCAE